jgi:uncharacterized membrane protein YozB (DUF420 family)
MTFADLPTLNATLNAITVALLVAGRIRIKRGDENAHRRLMIMALVTSVLFFTSYAIYHVQVGSVPYPFHDWTRTLYFAILIPHVILAAVLVPFIVALVTLALKSRFEKHRKLARFVWPVWIFVSVTGVAIYLMLYARG